MIDLVLSLLRQFRSEGLQLLNRCLRNGGISHADGSHRLDNPLIYVQPFGGDSSAAAASLKLDDVRVGEQRGILRVEAEPPANLAVGLVFKLRRLENNPRSHCVDLLGFHPRLERRLFFLRPGVRLLGVAAGRLALQLLHLRCDELQQVGLDLMPLSLRHYRNARAQHAHV